MSVRIFWCVSLDKALDILVCELISHGKRSKHMYQVVNDVQFIFAGIAHAMALGLGPWLAVEIPDLIDKGVITYKEKET